MPKTGQLYPGIKHWETEVFIHSRIGVLSHSNKLEVVYETHLNASKLHINV